MDEEPIMIKSITGGVGGDQEETLYISLEENGDSPRTVKIDAIEDMVLQGSEEGSPSSSPSGIRIVDVMSTLSEAGAATAFGEEQEEVFEIEIEGEEEEETPTPSTSSAAASWHKPVGPPSSSSATVSRATPHHETRTTMKVY